MLKVMGRGQTGTAQKILPGGGYSSNEFIASFMGVAPVNDPKITVLFIIDSPKGVYYGGQIAAPRFKNTVRDTLRYLQVEAQVEPNKIGNTHTSMISLPTFIGQVLRSRQEGGEAETC